MSYPKNHYGPSLSISQEIHEMKYRLPGEPFTDCCNRIASTLSDNDEHYHAVRDILLDMKFLPAGRVQAAIGSPRKVTPWNCFVSGVISDDFNDIMEKAKEAGHTMRLGGGIGYDFSTLRPRGSLIKSLGSQSSGPISFMDIFDSVCGTIASAGHRRGAQMGVLRVDHPDIEEFIYAKRNEHKLTRFNVSVGITDQFMRAVKEGKDFNLKFHNKIYKTVDARQLWDNIMQSTWHWAEPGVLFIDRINSDNNLWYCEAITTTNPSLRAGTKVITNSGIFPIEQLQDKTFKVKNLDGKLSDAKCFLSGKNKQLYRIKLDTGIEYYCTPEHKWPIITKNGPRKVETTEIRAGDKLPTLKQSSLFDGGLGSYEDGFITGWLYGDGWITDRKENNREFRQYGFICSTEDYGIAERISKYLKNITGSEYKGSVSDTGIEFNVSHPLIHKHFTKFGIDKKELGLPDFVWSEASEDYRKGLIDGLFSSDGHVGRQNQKRVQLTTKHLKLLKDTSELLGFYGIKTKQRTSVTSDVKFPNGKDYNRSYTRHDLRVDNQADIIHFRSLINLSNDKKKSRLEKYKWSNRAVQDHVIVQEIELTNLKEDVWDINVFDDTHCFQLSHCVTGNCGEQPLPPYGACLLGSFNLVKYVTTDRTFDYKSFTSDISHVVRAMDNIIDVGIYPLPQQETEGKSKRRMGLGVTGLANALEYLGLGYGSPAFIGEMSRILEVLRDTAYDTSADLAKEKGSFPAYEDKYLDGKFVQTLPPEVRQKIAQYGIRNSHLLSIAPTGTISLAADNISSGIEPVYTYSYTRAIQTFEGVRYEDVQDYAFREWGIKGRTANSLSPEEHVDVLINAQKYVDSSCSKTCNVGDDVDYERFKNIYMRAYDGGAKGCTTFRAAGKRKGILTEKPEPVEKEYVSDEDEVEVCVIDPVTGQPTCS